MIRNKIMANAEKRGWTIDAEQLDDRHIVRRMVLKRCVYGVDKNPMAVELAKVALWLHTFTVGAPLSFLDHHLRCGDSLSGSWVRTGIGQGDRARRSALFGRAVETGHARCGSLADHRGADRRRDCRGPSFRRSVREIEEDDDAIECLSFP